MSSGKFASSGVDPLDPGGPPAQTRGTTPDQVRGRLLRNSLDWELGQQMRPEFFESEEQPHVKEVNAGSPPHRGNEKGFGPLEAVLGFSYPRCQKSSLRRSAPLAIGTM